MTKQIPFYATRSDIVPIIRAVQLDIEVKFVRFGRHLRQDVQIYKSIDEIPDVGHSSSESGNSSVSYLIVPDEVKLLVRHVGGNSPKGAYTIDQVFNPNSVVLTPAGSWDDLLLAGRVATNSSDPAAQKIMKAFQKHMKRAFTKVRAYWLGPEATDFLKAGKRLAIAEQSSSEFDLKFPSSTDAR